MRGLSIFRQIARPQTRASLSPAIRDRAQRFHTIPVVDVSALTTLNGNTADLEETSQNLHRAMRDVGFCYITGHNVPEDLVVDVLTQTEAFFCLPRDEKEQISISKSSSFRGYQGYGENVTMGVRDRHEGLDLYRELPESHPLVQSGSCPNNGLNQWPSDQSLPLFRSTYAQYIAAMLRLGHQVMGGVALGLGLPRDAFDQYYSDPFWVMRAIAYPVQTDQEAKDSEQQFGDQGCGEHTDYGCLTIIAQNQFDGCLQVRNKEGEWVTADPLPDERAFVINIGDMIEVWTQGLLKATPHRVLQPTQEQGVLAGAEKRISVPFFFEPNYDAKIVPLELPQHKSSQQLYKPVVYGEHLYAKCTGNFT